MKEYEGAYGNLLRPARLPTRKRRSNASNPYPRRIETAREAETQCKFAYYAGAGGSIPTESRKKSTP